MLILCLAFQMIANNPMLASNPELQQQMVQMLPTMVERVCLLSCYIVFGKFCIYGCFFFE